MKNLQKLRDLFKAEGIEAATLYTAKEVIHYEDLETGQYLFHKNEEEVPCVYSDDHKTYN